MAEDDDFALSVQVINRYIERLSKVNHEMIVAQAQRIQQEQELDRLRTRLAEKDTLLEELQDTLSQREDELLELRRGKQIIEDQQMIELEHRVMIGQE